MKSLLAMAFLLLSAPGCIVEDEHPHHGRVAVVEAGHVHGPACGHVQIRGVWYDER